MNNSEKKLLLQYTYRMNSTMHISVAIGSIGFLLASLFKLIITVTGDFYISSLIIESGLFGFSVFVAKNAAFDLIKMNYEVRKVVNDIYEQSLKSFIEEKKLTEQEVYLYHEKYKYLSIINKKDRLTLNEKARSLLMINDLQMASAPN